MGIVNQRLERGRDDLLIGDVVDEQHHPGSHRVDRRQSFCKFRRGRRQLFRRGLIPRLQKVLPRGKMAVERSRPNTGLFRDVVEAGIRPGFSECLFRHHQDALAVLMKDLGETEAYAAGHRAEIVGILAPEMRMDPAAVKRAIDRLAFGVSPVMALKVRCR